MIGEQHERNYLDDRGTGCPVDLFRSAKYLRAAARARSWTDYGHYHGLRRNIVRRADVVVDYPVLICRCLARRRASGFTYAPLPS